MDGKSKNFTSCVDTSNYPLLTNCEPSSVIIPSALQAYLKFNQIKFEIKPAFEPNMSPSGRLPFLALSDGTFVTADGFEKWVQENRMESTETKLNHHEAAEALAFINLAESKIHAAVVSWSSYTSRIDFFRTTDMTNVTHLNPVVLSCSSHSFTLCGSIRPISPPRHVNITLDITNGSWRCCCPMSKGPGCLTRCS
jgi:hypothetical protein